MNELQVDIKDLIFEYRYALGNLLKEKLHGLYIYNSAAMGKFEPNYSDIDFVAVIKSHLTDCELDSLEELHKKLSLNHKYGSRLDGMYLQYSDLGKSNNEIEPYPYIEHTNFCKKGYFDINNITWWSLKEFDIAIDSPSICQELSHISWSSILNTMSYNLNSYWAAKLENSIIFEEDLWVEFGVVTLSRIIYTLEKNSIISKAEACEYIIDRFNEWEDVVREALAIRNLKAGSIIDDVNFRRDRTVEFIRFMINHGNKLIQVTSE